MRRHARPQARPLAAMAACLAAGIVIGWWLHASGGPRPSVIAVLKPTGTADSGIPAVADPRSGAPARESRVPTIQSAPPQRPGPSIGSDASDETESHDVIEMLRQRHLRVPLDGVDPSTFRAGFSEHRTGEGGHAHEAVDIHAPRNTPVHAVEDGTIAKVFESRAGGHTIYQFDSTERVCYYYAHLERYADGLQDGRHVAAGEVIGYVGTSGNAPPGAPHLHFAIFEIGPDRHWWRGKPIDPYLAFRR